MLSLESAETESKDLDDDEDREVNDVDIEDDERRSFFSNSVHDIVGRKCKDLELCVCLCVCVLYRYGVCNARRVNNHSVCNVGVFPILPEI